MVVAFVYFFAMTKTSSRKATHQGECQICGSTQMLPGGVLSKHGYTVQWGFFSGVCNGAGHLPFEQSKDAIAGVIASVEATIKLVEAEIAELENKDSEINGKDEAWRHCYDSYIGYTWRKVKLVEFERRNIYANDPGHEPAWYCYIKTLDTTKDRPDRPAKPDRLDVYDIRPESVRDFAHYLNGGYAKHLRGQNASRRQWITWQQNRLANWAPKPLKERGAK